MVSHVLVYLLAHEGKGPILHTFVIHKMGVQPFGLSDWLYARFFVACFRLKCYTWNGLL